MYGFSVVGRVLKNVEIQGEYSHTVLDSRKGYLVNIGIGLNYYYKKVMLGAGYVHFASNSAFYFTDNIPFYTQLKFPILY